MKKKIMLVTLSLLAVAALLWGPIVSNVEEANYQTITSYPNQIEVREYGELIVAEAITSGERQDAIGDGFREIADYIFGNNASKQDIAMTAPVMQQSYENEGWKVHFVMPANYNMQTLPAPENKNVTLKILPPKRYAVITFSGSSDNENIKKHEEILKNFMTEKNLPLLSQPAYAFFNPPWTLPFLKRNEVMIETK